MGSYKGENGEQRNRSVATPDEIMVLFDTLVRVLDEPLFNEEGKITKTTCRVVESAFVTHVEQPLENKIKKQFSAESVCDLFESYVNVNKESGEVPDNNTINIRTTNSTLNQVSALVLVLDHKIDLQKECAKIILNYHGWQRFQWVYTMPSYLLYYWRKNDVQIAVLNRNLSMKGNERGEITYYDKNEKTKKYIKRKESYTIDKYDVVDKVTYISAYINATDKNKLATHLVVTTHHLDTLPSACAYAVATGAGTPAAGIGILKKYDNVRETVNQINENDKIDDYIYNYLYQRRDELQESELTIPETSEELSEIKSLAGLWTGYYLRNDQPSEASVPSDKGGLEITFLSIRADGRVVMKKRPSEAKHAGFLTWHQDNMVKISLSPQPGGDYERYMFLTKKKDKFDRTILEGVLSGWTSANTPFSCLIRFEQFELSTKDNDVELKTNFIARGDIRDGVVPKKVFEFLQNENKYLNVAEDCLPEFTISKDQDNLVKLVGEYFIVSYNQDMWSLSKNVAVLNEDGTFEITFQDYQLAGRMEYLAIGKVDQDFITLNVRTRENKKGQVIPFYGQYIFYLGTLLTNNDSNIYDSLDIVAGLSLRLDSKQRLQAKKEYLLPFDKAHAISADEFKTGNNQFKFSYLNQDFFNGIRIPTGSTNTFLKELANSMKGADGNILQVTAEMLNNPNTNKLRKIDYKQLYWRAFLFEVLFPDTNKGSDSDAYEFLYEALKHGLSKGMPENEVRLVTQALKVQESTQQTITSKLTTIQEFIKTHYEQNKNLEVFAGMFANPAMYEMDARKKYLDGLINAIRNTIPK